MKRLKKVIKRVFISVLLVSIVLGNTPMETIFAEEDPMSGECGDNVYWELNSTREELRIYGQGRMINYQGASGAPWVKSKNLIKKVIIEQGVTYLGNEDFKYLINAENISISSSVNDIGECCFYGCSKLTNIIIPEGITSLHGYTFAYCYNLKNVEFPNTLKTINNYDFQECNSLETIMLPSSLTAIYPYAFYYCNNISTVHFKGETGGLKIYSHNDNIKELLTTHSTTFGDWSTVTEATCKDEGLKTRECSVCHEVEQQVIEKSPHSFLSWHTVHEPTCSMEGEKVRICSKCGSDEHESISKLNHTYSAWTVTREPTCSMEGEKQKSCSKCGDTQTESIEKLSHTYIENRVDPTKSQQGYTLHTCSVCGDNYKDNYVNYEDVYNEGTCGTNITYILNKETGLLQIEGSGDMNNYDKTNPPWFSDRALIKRVEISQGVTSVGDCAFADCYNLQTLVLPNSITTIGDNAFASCIKLNNVIIPNSVTTIGISAFYNCASFTDVTVPSSVNSLGKYAFASCINLQSAELKNSPSVIVEGLFEDCENLRNFTIPSTAKKIDDNAFSGCSSLTSLDIPNGVTGIGNGAYSYCSNINTVVIPLSTIWIGDGAFAGCDSLATTYYLGTKNDWSFVYMGKNNDKLLSGLNFHICAYTKTVVVKPTYTSKGYTIHICEVCGKQYIDSYVDPLKKNPKVPITKIKKVKTKKKSLKLTWKKANGITGYKIQYSLKKNFKKAKTITINRSNITSKTIKGLKKKKKYYIRIRTYLIASGKTYLSAWSKPKIKRTK